MGAARGGAGPRGWGPWWCAPRRAWPPHAQRHAWQSPRQAKFTSMFDGLRVNLDFDTFYIGNYPSPITLAAKVCSCDRFRVARDTSLNEKISGNLIAVVVVEGVLYVTGKRKHDGGHQNVGGECKRRVGAGGCGAGAGWGGGALAQQPLAS
ncbi:hypothetical protein HF086_014049 [Spodoptera exigua]|uniref:Uncharacterized protein n=1 Tax=Spodoptera exigua TaxID=7107 RepID=A0A922SIT5_SPOEX|nr:hypothetical protein HF086_014049 [Spodoptera exigua]